MPSRPMGCARSAPRESRSATWTSPRLSLTSPPASCFEGRHAEDSNAPATTLGPSRTRRTRRSMAARALAAHHWEESYDITRCVLPDRVVAGRRCHCRHDSNDGRLQQGPGQAVREAGTDHDVRNARAVGQFAGPFTRRSPRLAHRKSPDSHPWRSELVHTVGPGTVSTDRTARKCRHRRVVRQSCRNRHRLQTRWRKIPQFVIRLTDNRRVGPSSHPPVLGGPTHYGYCLLHRQYPASSA